MRLRKGDQLGIVQEITVWQYYEMTYTVNPSMKRKCMWVTVIQIVFCALVTVPKSLKRRPEELELRRSMEIIQTTEFLRSGKYSEESWRFEQTYRNADSIKIPPPNDRNYHLFLVISKLKTVVEGNQKTSFSIATTTSCRGGRYTFPWIAPLYPRYVPYIAEC